MKILNLEQANQILYDYIPDVIQDVNWSFALQDMQHLMKGLGDPQEKLRIIHVAGTSGKTSTSYYVADMLKRAGKTVGLTVSPHVDSVNERVQINGQKLSEQDFCNALGEFLEIPTVQQTKASYFGLLAAFAYWYFAHKQVDYAVVEVGMGGRLDATNVVARPDKLCVITDIGFDHMHMLGNTIAAIATEKAGIIQEENMVLVARQDEEALQVIRARANEKHAELTIIAQSAEAPDVLPLFQRRNWSLAKAAVETLAVRDEFQVSLQTLQASAAVRVPGRMEVTKWKGKTLICDGAHNAQKIAALTGSIAQKYPGQKAVVLLSFIEGKDTALADSMKSLQSIADRIIVTKFENAQDMSRKSIEPAQIAEAATTAGFSEVRVIEDPEEALQVLEGDAHQLCVITGSLYLLHHLRPAIEDAA